MYIYITIARVADPNWSRARCIWRKRKKKKGKKKREIKEKEGEEEEKEKEKRESVTGRYRQPRRSVDQEGRGGREKKEKKGKKPRGKVH